MFKKKVIISSLIVVVIILPMSFVASKSLKKSTINEQTGSKIIPIETYVPSPTVNNSSLKYVALGDSIAAGLGVRYSYVQRVADYIEEHKKEKVDLKNLAVSGWTSKDLLVAVKTSKEYQDSIKSAHLITIDIGGNDMIFARDLYQAQGCGGSDNKECLDKTIKQFQDNFDQIIKEIRNQNTSLDNKIIVMDYYYPFVNIDKEKNTKPQNGGNDFDVFAKYFKDLNNYIADYSNRNRLQLAQVSQDFNGQSGNDAPTDKGLINVDNTHPNEKGHSVIMSEFEKIDL